MNEHIFTILDKMRKEKFRLNFYNDDSSWYFRIYKPIYVNAYSKNFLKGLIILLKNYCKERRKQIESQKNNEIQ